MLPAQKEQIRLASATPEDLPNVSSFGKVVNSIQGLQQRLDNFSADDIGVAHDKTQTLLSRLADLQRKLTAYIEINRAMIAVRDSVNQIVTDSLDHAKLELPEQPLRIQSLIQANKLVQFPRLHRSPTVPSLPLNSEKELLAVSVTAGKDDSRTLTTPESSEEPVSNQSQNSDLQKSEILAAPHGEGPSPASAREQNTPEPPPLSLVNNHAEITAGDSVVAPEVIPRPATGSKAEFDDLLVRGDASTARPAEIVPDSSVIEHSVPNTSTDFDQRLLDDLIKNYGEFAAAIAPSRTADAQNAATSDSTTSVPDDSPQIEAVVAERKNLPSINKQGDIDRQLKKIIKDYGEYDLYSRQGPVSLKTGVIGAFVLLGLVLSGFYYFSPGGSQNSASVSSGSSHPSNNSVSKERQKVANQPGGIPSETGMVRGADTNSQSKNRK